jgi:hypothetical protein
MTATFVRHRTPPTAEVLYGRRVLAEAAALIRDGQLGGNVADFDLDPVEGRRACAEIALWLDIFAESLKSVTPQNTASTRRPR